MRACVCACEGAPPRLAAGADPTRPPAPLPARSLRQLKKTRSPAAQKSIKARALQTIKRKRMYESERDGMLSRGFNMEQMNFAQENAKTTYETLEAMKASRDVLRTEHKKFDVSAVEDLHDDMDDLLADADEINELMGRSYAARARCACDCPVWAPPIRHVCPACASRD